MLKKIGKIVNGRLLSNQEQKLIFGGARLINDCSIDGNCAPGFCCSFGVCVSTAPDENGLVHACE